MHRITPSYSPKYVRHREFTAEGVAAVGEVHLADLVGICLHENGNVCILQGCGRALYLVLCSNKLNSKTQDIVLFISFEI